MNDDRSPTSPRKPGLLLLAAIFAALGLVSAILLPPTILSGGAGEKARRANCLSNLKQIGLAMEMYANLYNGRLPMDSANPTLAGSLQLLSNFVSSAKIYHCYSDQRGKATANIEEMTATNISYSYVPNLNWQDHPDSIIALDRIYVTEKGSKWPKTGNHKDTGGNVLFGDGHVAWHPELPVALKDKDGKQVVLSP